jgi:hypothetical protein
MTLEELRRKRADHMRAVIEGQRAPAGPDIVQFHAELHRADLSACAARELEWLQPVVTLQDKPPVRTTTAPHSPQGVVAPFSPSMLVVIYSARYYLSGSDVYTVYGALQAVLLPSTRGIDIDL